MSSFPKCRRVYFHVWIFNTLRVEIWYVRLQDIWLSHTNDISCHKNSLLSIYAFPNNIVIVHNMHILSSFKQIHYAERREIWLYLFIGWSCLSSGSTRSKRLQPFKFVVCLKFVCTPTLAYACLLLCAFTVTPFPLLSLLQLWCSHLLSNVGRIHWPGFRALWVSFCLLCNSMLYTLTLEVVGYCWRIVSFHAAIKFGVYLPLCDLDCGEFLLKWNG